MPDGKIEHREQEVAKQSKTQVKPAQKIKLTTKNMKWVRVIEEYLTNGHDAAEAYSIVYKDCKTIPQSVNQLFKNIKFNEMLELRVNEIKAGTERKISELDAMYVADRNLARRLKQPSAAVSATTGIARLYGMDKDAGGKMDLPADLTPSQLKELQEYAKFKNQKDLDKPRLVKEKTA